jgi:hypothetical protein
VLVDYLERSLDSILAGRFQPGAPKSYLLDRDYVAKREREQQQQQQQAAAASAAEQDSLVLMASRDQQVEHV